MGSEIKTPYGRVHTEFWADTSWWPEDARLMALYMLTCPGRSAEGFFRMPLQGPSNALRMASEGALDAIGKLVGLGWCEYDLQHETLLIVGTLKWYQPSNENHRKHAVRQFVSTPSRTPLRARFRALAEQLCPALAADLPAVEGSELTPSGVLVPPLTVERPDTDFTALMSPAMRRAFEGPSDAIPHGISMPSEGNPNTPVPVPAPALVPTPSLKSSQNPRTNSEQNQ